jgi:ParB/RepB/Spo0J family partition protein
MAKSRRDTDSSPGTASTGGSRTLQALGGISLTDMMSRGGAVPGVSEQEQPNDSLSLYQVQEVPIEDILPSDYQTRETVEPERYARLVKSMQEEGPTEYKDAIPVRKHPTIPNKWQVARGGHTRLKAAIDAGLTAYPIIVVEYNNKRSALATGRENLARADELSPVEEGRYYILVRKEFGYTQEEFADELGIDRDRIKECEAAAKSAPYILDMFARIKEIGGDTKRGLRAAKCFRRLAVLDEREPGLAARLCKPLIDAFLYERLTTDGVDIATKRIVQADDPEAVVVALIRDLQRSETEEQESSSRQDQHASAKKEKSAPEIERSARLNLAIRRFQQFTSFIGAQPPSQEERKVLINMREEIDRLLQRSFGDASPNMG